MLLCADYVLPITSDPIANGAVLVRDGKICDLGRTDKLRLRYPDEECRVYKESVLMPGFVNTHAHVDGSVLRGVVHDAPYSEWVTRVAKAHAQLSSFDLYYSAVVGCLEAIRCGITTIADITSSGAAVEAVNDTGLRGVVYREVVAMDKRRVDRAMGIAASDIEEWAGKVNGDRILMGIAPAPLFWCHPLVYRRCAEYAGDSLRVAMHIAGGKEEDDFVRYGSSPFSVHGMEEKRGFVDIPPWLPTGVTPVKFVLNWGAFEAKHTMALHLINVNDGDIAKLKQYGVSVALSPRANAQLGQGVAPMTEFLKQGFRIGLGTNSPAATNSTDMLEEMRIGMILQRALNTNTYLPADTMLDMATMGGARALHLENSIGSLEIGKCADIIAMDVSQSHQMPSDDVASAIVNTTSGTDVVMTMVGGKVLYEHGKWSVSVDADACIEYATGVHKKLRG